MNETKSSENKDECDTTKDKGESNVFLNKVIGVKEGEESIDKTFCVIEYNEEDENMFVGKRCTTTLAHYSCHMTKDSKVST